MFFDVLKTIRKFSPTLALFDVEKKPTPKKVFNFLVFLKLLTYFCYFIKYATCMRMRIYFSTLIKNTTLYMEQILPFSAMKKSAKPTSKRLKTILAAILMSVLGMGSVQAQCDLDPADFTLTVQQSLVNATQLKCTYNGSSQSWSNNWALYVTNLTTGETQTYVSSSTTKSITSISAGEYSWYIRAICSTNDTSNIVNGDNFTVTYEPWPTWTNFQFQKSTDTYYLYCNNMIDYDFSSGNNLNNTTGVSNNGNNITYTFEPEGICTYNNQTNRLNFTGEPGDVVITATISGYNSHPDTSASFTLTVIKPELKFERVTITPQCRSNMDDGQIEFTVSDDQCPNRNYIHSIISSPDTVFDLGLNGYSGIRPNIPENTYTINVYLVDPNNTDVSVGISKDTTFVLPRKIQISVVGDGETTCALNPDLRLIANPTNSDGTSGGYSYSWKVNGTELSTYQHFDLTSDYTSPTVTVTDGSSCSSTYTPTINWIDGYGTITVDTIAVTPACGGDNGTITASVSSECGTPVLEYSLNGGYEVNTTGVFTYLPTGSYTLSINDIEGTSGFSFDTSLTITNGCCISLSSESHATNWGERVNAIDNGNGYEFVVGFKAFIDGDDGETYDERTKFEVQYKRSDQDEWNSVIQNYDTNFFLSDGYVWVPANTKGVWQARCRVICENGDANEWTDIYSTANYFYTEPDHNPIELYGDNGNVLCGNNSLSVSFDKSEGDYYKANSELEYFLINSQGDTLDGPNDGSVSVAWLDNITESGTYTIAATIQIGDDLFITTPYDTTFVVDPIIPCDIPSDGSTDLNIIGFTWGDDDPPAPDFFYLIRVPFTAEVLHGGNLVSVEAQYRKTGEEEWTSIYLNASTGDSIIELPITSKGNWEVRMRARCCGSYPGNLPGDWVLTDTIHQYASTLISSLTYTDVCHGDDGTVALELAMPYNIEPPCEHPLCVDLGWFLVNAADSSYVATDNCLETHIVAEDLAEGTYRLITKLTDNECGWFANSFDAFFDTTFTIGRKINVTIENDSSVFCSNDSVLYRAIVTGGTEPYSYEWGALETLYGTVDSVWITGNMYGDSSPSVTVTDASGCSIDQSIHFTIHPAYTEEDEEFVHNMFGDNSYSYDAGRRGVSGNQCPFTWSNVTYNCAIADTTLEAAFLSVDGCDSVQKMRFTYLNERSVALPGNGTLDTTIDNTDAWRLYDDGGDLGLCTLNGNATAIVRAPSANDRLVVDHILGHMTDNDTVYVYKGVGVDEANLVYSQSGTSPQSEIFKLVNSNAMTVRFVTGSSRDGQTAHGMGMIGVYVKSPEQITVSPICGGAGSVQVNNPMAMVVYILTHPGGTYDTLVCESSGQNIIFTGLTESGNYTLKSYVIEDYETTLNPTGQDTSFTVPAASFELSVTGDSTTVCSVNPSVTLTASVSGGEAPYAYSWSNGSTSTSITINEAYASPTVTVTDNSGCSITYATILNWIDYVESEEATEASVCNGAETYTWGSKTITLSDEHLDNGYYVYYDTVESGGTCPTISELHLTVKPNATTEVRVLEWGTSYTWPVNGNSYTTSLGGYSDTVNGCPVTVEYENEAATATHSGAASNGCDSIYSLNLTLIDGIPIPASGTTDTTLSTMVEGDTLWVYDNGGMLFNYDIEGNGILILRAPEDYAIKVAVSEMELGEGAKVYYTELENFNGSWYYENNGNNNSHEYASNSGLLKLKYDGGDSPAQGKGFKLAVTVKSLDDTCMSIYNLAKNAEVYGQQTLTWQHTGRISEYRVKVGIQDNTIDEYTPIVDTIVTDTTITLYGDWTPLINGYYPLEIWAICGDNDSSTVYSDWMETQCGFRPGLADGESYHAPAIIKLSSYNEDEIYGQMPPCWSRIGYQIPATDSVFPQLNGVYGGDSDWSGIYFYTNAENDQYAIMPKFDTLYGGMNQWALDFVLELAEYAHQTECDVEPVVLYVGVMDNPSDANSFTVVDSVLVNSNDFRSEYGNEYYVSLANYSGDGLYPAFKMARRSAHNDNPYANPTLMLYEMLVIPDGGLSAPTNLTVTKHPTYDDKAVLSWTEPVWPAYGDDYAVSYVVSTTNSSGNTSSTEVDFGQTSYTFTPAAGDITKITIATKVTSARYNTNWRVESEEVTYEAPFYTHQTVDTIGDLSDERLYSYLMPFEYGNSASSEMLIKADEIDGTTIDALAFRLAPESCLTPEDFPSFQYVTIYMKDVTLTQLNAANMTDDYLFSADNKVYDGTTSGGTDGWLIFTLNQTYTRDPDKNLLIGVASSAGDNAAYYSGYAKFYMEADGNDQLALSFEGASGLTTMPGSTNQYYRPQMKLVAAKNCTNDSVIVDTNLCENASIDWRGHTISFSDDDISQHYIIIDSTYNDSWDEWDYIYRYVYTEKVEGASASGCDSVYQLRLNKLYNEDNGYDAENSSYPHEVSCGPYTWRNGVTYTQSMGTYEYYNGDCPAYGSYGPRVYDTVPGAASNGCDSIYGLNLRVDSWFTVVFDTTGVDAGTGIEKVTACKKQHPLISFGY